MDRPYAGECVDQARRESLYRGYRLINIVGIALLGTVGVLLAFSASYVAGMRHWNDLPLGATWTDMLVFALAVAVPPAARWGAEEVITKAARRGRGLHLAAAIQIVGWAAVGLWTSCQVPVLIGFGLAYLRERLLYLLPFYAVAVACAFLVVPRFKTWEHWFHLLENPGKRTRIRSA